MLDNAYVYDFKWTKIENRDRENCTLMVTPMVPHSQGLCVFASLSRDLVVSPRA